MTDIKRASKVDAEWEEAKEKAKKTPWKLVEARTYNHFTNAFRDARMINNGIHRAFPRQDNVNLWAARAEPTGATAVGVRSKKETPVYTVQIMYIGATP